MKYTPLTQDERYQIAILAKAGHDRSDIARVMDRHVTSFLAMTESISTFLSQVPPVISVRQQG